MHACCGRVATGGSEVPACGMASRSEVDSGIGARLCTWLAATSVAACTSASSASSAAISAASSSLSTPTSVFGIGEGSSSPPRGVHCVAISAMTVVCVAISNMGAAMLLSGDVWAGEGRGDVRMGDRRLGPDSGEDNVSRRRGVSPLCVEWYSSSSKSSPASCKRSYARVGQPFWSRRDTPFRSAKRENHPSLRAARASVPKDPFSSKRPSPHASMHSSATQTVARRKAAMLSTMRASSTSNSVGHFPTAALEQR